MQGSLQLQERSRYSSKRSHNNWAGGDEMVPQTSVQAEARNSLGKRGSAQLRGEQM